MLYLAISLLAVGLSRFALGLALWWTNHRLLMRASEAAEHPDQFAINWLRILTGRFEPLPTEVGSRKLNPRPPSRPSKKRTNKSSRKGPPSAQPIKLGSAVTPDPAAPTAPASPAAPASVVPIRPTVATGTDDSLGCPF
jgi:hypothetical protein